ncbi:hypothetical protein FK535_12380 [Mycolicibacterium sp. 018/SC-01/001]|uniref:hypothetical protein n=1 Tax=Mycolicibacterium sp. 018/SC-01/001 TaxID=2592069 RepID=UPI0011808623|nr:hypothetical protein [Mycolicibacterium sp. 018/SC-01/001]TRW82753.1 hypothetical protein FK535_12380 [Mycolicibacterium sp. 018/SC-01/001]
MIGRLAPAARLVIAAAMLAAATWLWLQLPTKMQSWAPIEVTGAVGEHVEGRNLAVTVHDVQLARVITFTNDGVPVRMSTDGAWLVTVLSYEPLLSAESPVFELTADGRRFTSPLSGFDRNAPPGLTQRSVVAFEVPTVPTLAELLVYNKTIDQYGNPMPAPLDSAIAVPLPVPDEALPQLDLNKATAL